MNTPVSTPRVSAFALLISKGLNQDSDGSIAPADASPAATRTIATIPNSSSAATWAKISTRWKCADSSVPITQIAVITRMIAIANIVTATFESRSESSVARSKM